MGDGAGRTSPRDLQQQQQKNKNKKSKRSSGKRKEPEEAEEAKKRERERERGRERGKSKERADGESTLEGLGPFKISALLRTEGVEAVQASTGSYVSTGIQSVLASYFYFTTEQTPPAISLSLPLSLYLSHLDILTSPPASQQQWRSTSSDDMYYDPLYRIIAAPALPSKKRGRPPHALHGGPPLRFSPFLRHPAQGEREGEGGRGREREGE
ncbi:hypothetical protein TRV_01337 [Trichophyton verrucosum HKI 0517]|uniref:Uncharacterized protein n=1 Tax=Trichophyton verrucosum (strain HKI 0517) TaxID=663202 RepID=D4D2N1_TRIVH|nr:uncharacterized protein TRV_01337 [Trichophyton verrucosum HKI 0517]EFE43895.1 hypothetical protein TRV_01337 [Trichophyton verrucosum HKI 0517]